MDILNNKNKNDKIYNIMTKTLTKMIFSLLLLINIIIIRKQQRR